MKNLDLEPIAPGALSELVWERLRDAILSGGLEPGDRIVETEVARQLHISLAPVREALQRLEQEGLVVKFRHQGTFVSEWSIDEMREAFELRAIIEGHAARLLTQRAATVDLTPLQQAIDRMVEAAAGGEEAVFIENDLDFHEHLCSLAGHKTLLRIWRILAAPYLLHTRVIVRHHHYDLKQIAESHMPILAALSASDPLGAQQRAEEHLHQAWTRFEAILTPSPKDQKVNGVNIP